MNSFPPTFLVRLRHCAGAAVLVIGLFAFGTSFGAAYPEEGLQIEWVQPDGTNLELRVFGSDAGARTETEGGYTVVLDPSDLAYYYSVLADDGKSLVSSGVPAHQPPPEGLSSHLALPSDKGLLDESDPGEAARRARWEERVKAAQLRRERAAGRLSDIHSEADLVSVTALDRPVVGKVVGLMILVQFPDDPKTGAIDPVNFPTDVAKIERYCNQIGYAEDGNSNSIRGYFDYQSLGKLDLTHVVTPILTLPHPRNYYNYADYPHNDVLMTGLGQQLLIRDAIEVLRDQGFDFSVLTADGLGRILDTSLLFAGPSSGVWLEGLWPHKWDLAYESNDQYYLDPLSVGTPGNPRYVLGYQITDMPDVAPRIGTVCHELGHLVLDIPDLYDSYKQDGDSAGIGQHCLMGGGNHLNDKRSPASINLYVKDILGWATVTDIEAGDQVVASLPTTGNVGYRIFKPGSVSEFFVFENRGFPDPHAAWSPDQGIMVWHVDEEKRSTAKRPNGEQQATAEKHYYVSLVQADGLYDMENNRNKGDGYDLFSNTVEEFSRGDEFEEFFGIGEDDYETATQFNDFSNPNANWWDGTNSGIGFEALSGVGKFMTVSFGGRHVTTLADSGIGSLRWAIEGTLRAEDVRFAPELSGGTILLNSQLLIGRSMGIDASDLPEGITIDGGDATRVFFVHEPSAFVRFDGVTITGGRAAGPDADGFGGGILSVGRRLDVRNSTFHGNFAERGSAIHQNRPDGAAPGLVRIINSTIADNRAGLDASVFNSKGLMEIENSTVANNRNLSDAVGAGVTNFGSLRLKNSIVAGNTGSGAGLILSDLAGDYWASGINVVPFHDGNRIGGPASITQDPNLGPLADNGGPTLTMLPGAISSALEFTSLARDQRGIQRPAIAGTKVTLGAVEVPQGPRLRIKAPTGRVLPVDSGSVRFYDIPPSISSALLSFRVANHGNELLTGVSLSIEGPDAAFFSIVSTPSSEVLPGAEEVFQVRLVPSTPGEKSATLLIASDDPEQSLYTLSLSGKGNNSYSITRSTGGTLAQLPLSPKWNRPEAGEPLVDLSLAATDTPHDVVSFTVDQAGEYRLRSAAINAGWDNQLFLYHGPFSAAAPLINGLIGSTAENVDFVFDLYPGIRYYAITTGATDFDYGDYALSILGPGNVEALTPPSIVTPQLSQSEVSVYVEFVWDSVPGVFYEVSIGTDPDNLSSVGLQQSGFRFDGPLSHGTTYYWRLQSSFPGGVISDGIRSFTTRESVEVTLLEDEDDGALGLGAGDSLREAIEAAEAGEASVIAFSPELSGKTIELDGAQITTSGDFTLDGSALPLGITISGANRSRVFEIGASSTVVLDSVTITGGLLGTGEDGGGILNRGDLTLIDSEVRENLAEGGSGGGIQNIGALALENSTLAGNRALEGGGLSNEGAGALAILTNVTISGNTGSSSGGGIANTASASASLVHTTISNNSASVGKGGGIAIDSGSIGIENTVVADNDALSGRFSIDKAGGTVTKAGANLIGDNTSVVSEFPTGVFAGTSSSPLDPGLSPLDFFKGRTRTMTPLPGSLALNAAVATGNTPSRGQRGVQRPKGIASEIGAVESDLSSDSELSSLAISAGKLDPIFERKVNEYAALVDYDVSSVRFRANVRSSANSTSRARVNGGDYSALVYGDASIGLPLVSGLNTVEVEVTAQDLTVNTYEVSVIRGSSTETNTDLSALQLSGGTLSPTFSIGTTVYSSIVGNETDSITVTPTAGIEDAAVEVAVNFGDFTAVESGEASTALDLDVGANFIEVRVTSQDGTTVATHDLTVLREATANSNANLSSLATTAGSLRPVFGRELRSYGVRVAENVTSTTVTPAAVQPSLATLEVRINDGAFTAISSGAASSSLALDPGANVIDVKVTSQDDTTENTYSLKVTRTSHNLEWLSQLSGSPANNTSGNPSISADGRFVAFSSTATNLVAGDTNNSEDVFVYDRDNDTIERVSVNDLGQQGTYNSSGGSAHSKNPSISADGVFVAFQSRANNFVDTDGDGNFNEGEDSNGQSDASQGEDIFVYNRESKKITRVSLRDNGSESQQPRAENPSISADGNFVAFSSSASNLDSDSESDSSNNVNIYLCEWKTGAVERIDLDLVDFRANFDLLNPSVSEDGSFVAFELSVNRSESPQYQYKDVYLYERSGTPGVKGTTTGITSTYEGLLSDGNHSWAPSISNDGRYIAFHSNVDGIDFDDENRAIDVFLYDRIRNRTKRLSSSPSGADESFQNSGNPAISGDGRYVTFQSRASNLVDPATNGMTQIFRHDLQTGETAIMSINNSDTEGNQDSGRNLDVGQFAGPPAISFDGQFIAFESFATNLAATGGSAKSQIFVAVNDAFSASADANLAGLASNLGQLSFAGSSFSSAVSHEQDTVMLSPFAVDSESRIEMQVNSGAFVAVDQNSIAAASLDVGANSINLRITAADSVTVNTVTLDVTRNPSTIATLSNLVFNGGIVGAPEEAPPTAELAPEFDSSVTAYTATALHEVTSLTVRPTLEQEDAHVTVNGVVVNSGEDSGEIALAIGENTITTVVTAQDATTTRTYVTTVVRIGSNNANLESLSSSVGALAPRFSSQNTSYAFNVAEDTVSLAVTPTAADPAATITINGEVVVSGAASTPINLFPGINTVEVTVRAPSGERRKSYTLEVQLGADQAIPLMITEIRLSDGSASKLLVSWGSEADVVYYLERSTDMLLWEEFGDDLPSAGETTSAEIDLEHPTSKKHFFRVGQR